MRSRHQGQPLRESPRAQSQAAVPGWAPRPPRCQRLLLACAQHTVGRLPPADLGQGHLGTRTHKEGRSPKGTLCDALTIGARSSQSSGHTVQVHHCRECPEGRDLPRSQAQQRKIQVSPYPGQSWFHKYVCHLSLSALLSRRVYPY